MVGQPIAKWVLDWDLVGWWFSMPWCSHNKIGTAGVSLSKALIAILLQGGNHSGLKSIS